MAWGCNKFLKKLIKPNAISNNELADFISRVPDNEELVSMVDFFSFIHTQMKYILLRWSKFGYFSIYTYLFPCRKIFKSYHLLKMLQKQNFKSKRNRHPMQKLFKTGISFFAKTYNLPSKIPFIIPKNCSVTYCLGMII